MESVGKIMGKKHINVNTVNKSLTNNDSNVASKNRYALDKNKFTPNTPETQLAEQIATSFNDLDNYAGFLSVVNKIGHERAYGLWKSIKEEIEEKKGTKYAIRYPAKYFMWKYRKGWY